MFLLILEQIGNMELLFIGLVVLIVFGPRKIPELAKTAGKWMYEIRKVSNEFKETWEKEAELSEDERQAFDFSENSIAADPALPEIEEVSGASVETMDEESPNVSEVTDEDTIQALKEQAAELKEESESPPPEEDLNEKQNWL